MKETKAQKKIRLDVLTKLDIAIKEIMEASELITNKKISEDLRNIAYEIFRVLNDSANRKW